LGFIKFVLGHAIFRLVVVVSQKARVLKEVNTIKVDGESWGGWARPKQGFGKSQRASSKKPHNKPRKRQTQKGIQGWK